jgi:hypothetical protein
MPRIPLVTEASMTAEQHRVYEAMRTGVRRSPRRMGSHHHYPPSPATRGRAGDGVPGSWRCPLPNPPPLRGRGRVISRTLAETLCHALAIAA